MKTKVEDFNYGGSTVQSNRERVKKKKRGEEACASRMEQVSKVLAVIKHYQLE